MNASASALLIHQVIDLRTASILTPANLVEFRIPQCIPEENGGDSDPELRFPVLKSCDGTAP